MTGGLLALLSAKHSIKVTGITIVIIIIFLTHMTCFLNEVLRFLKKSEVSWRPSHIHHEYSINVGGLHPPSSSPALSCCLVKCFTNDKLSPRMEFGTTIIMKTFCH